MSWSTQSHLTAVNPEINIRKNSKDVDTGVSRWGGGGNLEDLPDASCSTRNMEIWRRKVNKNIEQKLGVEDLPDISCSTKNMKKENG